MTPRAAKSSTATGKAKAATAADTRSRILDAALATFREKGFSATTVDDLCRAAGVTKGAFFHHFAGKEAATLAAIDHWNTGTGAMFAAAAYQRVDDPRARLLAYLDARDALADGSPAEYCCLLGTLLQDVHATHPVLKAACEDGIERHLQTLVPTIAAARDRHAPGADWDPAGLSAHIQAVLQGAFVLGKARGDSTPVQDALAHLRRYVGQLLPVDADPPKKPTSRRTP